MDIVEKTVIKQKNRIFRSKIIMLVIVILFDVFLLLNFLYQSIYVRLGIIFLLLISVMYFLNIKNEIYSLSVDDSELRIRFYFKKKIYPVSAIEKVYRIAEHNISFNRRYGVVKAISIIANGQRYTVSEEYTDFLFI